MIYFTPLDLRIYSNASAKALNMAGMVASPKGAGSPHTQSPAKTHLRSGGLQGGLASICRHPVYVSTFALSAPSPSKCISIAASSVDEYDA